MHLGRANDLDHHWIWIPKFKYNNIVATFIIYQGNSLARLAYFYLKDPTSSEPAIGGS